MRRRGLRLAWSWLLGAAAVGAVAWSLAGETRTLGLAFAVVGVIILILAYDMYSEAMTQSRANGLTTTRAHQAWLLLLCFCASGTIIGFPVQLLMVWNRHNIHAMVVEALRSIELGGHAPNVLILISQGVTTNAILGSLAAVSIMTLWRLYIRPHDLWRAAAPSAVGTREQMKKGGPAATNADCD